MARIFQCDYVPQQSSFCIYCHYLVLLIVFMAFHPAALFLSPTPFLTRFGENTQIFLGGSGFPWEQTSWVQLLVGWGPGQGGCG